ncbi:MAG: type II toxin-antitoxin system Phd/YefM family antitoxin [Nitrospirae bacterium]|nr:MAG: type II toxin-antitoxin system Phd/YefM family antitoxin [Nitrospirota bacterium]
MKTVSATEFSRNFSAIMDRVEHGHEEFIVVRNNHEVARIVPGPAFMTALEALADLYRTIPDSAGKDWLGDSRKSGKKMKDAVRDPWAS